MLAPLTHSWTRTQKGLIVASVLVALGLFATVVYTYERCHRMPSDAVFVGLWEVQGLYMDCTFYLQFQPNHDVLGFGEDLDKKEPGMRFGRWYAGGELLVIHYNTAAQASSLLMRIVDISPDLIRLRRKGEEVLMVRSASAPPQASNQVDEADSEQPGVRGNDLATYVPLRFSSLPVRCLSSSSR